MLWDRTTCPPKKFYIHCTSHLIMIGNTQLLKTKGAFTYITIRDSYRNLDRKNNQIFKKKKKKLEQCHRISWFSLNKCLIIGLQIGYSSPAESGIIEDLDISLAAVRTSNLWFMVYLYIHYISSICCLLLCTFLLMR